MLFSFLFFFLSPTSYLPPLPHPRTLPSAPLAAPGLRLRVLSVPGAVRLRNHVCRRRCSRGHARTTLLPEAAGQVLHHRGFRGCDGSPCCQLCQRLHREVRGHPYDSCHVDFSGKTSDHVHQYQCFHLLHEVQRDRQQPGRDGDADLPGWHQRHRLGTSTALMIVCT